LVNFDLYDTRHTQYTPVKPTEHGHMSGAQLLSELTTLTPQQQLKLTVQHGGFGSSWSNWSSWKMGYEIV